MLQQEIGCIEENVQAVHSKAITGVNNIKTYQHKNLITKSSHIQFISFNAPWWRALKLITGVISRTRIKKTL